MIAVDGALLAFAANRGAPGHLRAAAALEALAEGERPWGLPVSAAHRFLRLVTHPHAVARTLGAADAWALVERLLASPGARLLTPTADHPRVVGEVLGAWGLAGSLPAGFETAVLLREHGVRELLSPDRTMRRFAFLAVRDPLHGPAWSPAERPSRRYRVLSPRAAS